MKGRKILRQVIVGSFIGVTAVSVILTVMMIRDCIGVSTAESRLVRSEGGSGDSLMPGSAGSDGSGPDLHAGIDSSVTEAQMSLDTAVSGSLSRNGSESGIKVETTPGADEGSGMEGALIPLQIEPVRSREEIAFTAAFFKGRIPYLQQAMQESGLFFSEKLLDPGSGTKAYILAQNENCAQNLNAYFYYLFDETGSANILSPYVLNLSLLFDEANRKTVTDSGTFAEAGHMKALRQTLTASLGPYYDIQVFDFIMNEYKRTFQDRLAGKPLQTPVYKLQLPKLGVVFHNSFLTYAEFFISP